MIWLSSIFRNAEHYLDRYIAQVTELEQAIGQKVKLVLAEGDSTDDTWDALHRKLDESGLDSILMKVEHGGPTFGSVNDPQRWAQIAKVCEAVRHYVASRIADEDAWIYVESDLVWPADTMISLLDDLVLPGVQAVAPLSLIGDTDRFYDIWGHTKDGRRFFADPPYHTGLQGHGLEKINTAGSCFALPGRWVRRVAFSPVDCIRGIGHTLMANGESLWLDQDVEVRHP